MAMEGLMGARYEPPTANTNPEYDELVGINPGFGPVEGNVEPTPEEQAHWDNLFADFIHNLYGKSEDSAVTMMKSSPQLYQGVAKVAFTVLQATYTQYEQKEGKVDPSILFGEGGMISTAVDEVYKMAQASGIPAAADMNHYSAAQMEAMRLVGEYLEKSQDDGAIDEAQTLLMDIDVAGGGGGYAQPLNQEDRQTLRESQMPAEQVEQPPMATGGPTQQMPPEGLV